MKHLKTGRDTGLGVASSPVQLLPKTSGFSYFVPVYQYSQSVQTLDQKRNAHLGFALSVFRMDRLISQIQTIDSDSKTIQFSVYDTQSQAFLIKVGADF